MIIVGIDVSKDWFDADWRQSEITYCRHYDYTEEGIQQLLDQAPDEAIFVMEATGVYHVLLAIRLYKAHRQVSVVNPLVIKRYGQMKLSRAKSDPADARLIRGYGEHEQLSLWQPDSEAVQELQQAHGWLHDLITERTRLLNRQQALAHRVQSSRFVQRQMKAQLKQLEQRIKACEAYLDEQVKKNFEVLYEHLLSIPAVGAKTAAELIIITDGFRRFDSIKALSAYAGVSPRTYCSGSSVRGKGSIAKLGNGRIRQLLYLCSWSAQKCNPACMRLAERLQEAGKPSKVIHIAVAHKILRQAYAVATKGVPFSPEFA